MTQTQEERFILISARHLRTVLSALRGPSYMIQELMITASYDNNDPIQSLIVQFNQQNGKDRLADLNNLQAALKQCADWFAEYGDMHTKKNAPEKAARNYERAKFARSVLAKIDTQP